LLTRRLISGVRFFRPVTHLFHASLFRLDEGQGRGRAHLDAIRITPAQIALVYFCGNAIVVDGAERTGDGADLATDTKRRRNLLGAGICVDGNGVHRTGLQAPGVGALGAYIRHIAARFLELEG